MDLDDITDDRDLTQWLYEALLTHPNLPNGLKVEYFTPRPDEGGYHSVHHHIVLKLPNGEEFQVNITPYDKADHNWRNGW